jgi:hypothetical protein
MDAGECSMVKRASEVTKVLRSMATSSREVSHTELQAAGEAGTDRQAAVWEAIVQKARLGCGPPLMSL